MRFQPGAPFRGRSSIAEHLPDMQKVEGATPSVLTIDRLTLRRYIVRCGVDGLGSIPQTTSFAAVASGFASGWSCEWGLACMGIELGTCRARCDFRALRQRKACAR